MKPAPIYLDYASTTPCAPEVIAAMQPYWADSFGNAAAAGIAGRRAAAVIEDAKKDIAALIGSAGEAITLTSGATESNTLALLGAAAARRDSARDEVIISAIEHASLRGAAEKLTAQGMTVKTAPVTAAGVVTPESLAALLSPRTFMVSMIAAGHETGVVQDIPALSQLARAAGALFHTDAAQAAGKMPIDVAAWGADMLTLSAHKIYGPQGIGALYVRAAPPLAVTPQLGGSGGQALRAGTVPLALAAGFGAACCLAAARMDADIESAAKSRDVFLSALSVRGICFSLNSAGAEKTLPHILNLRIADIDAADMMLALSGEIAFSTGSACRSGKPSAVLAAMGLTAAESAQSIRLCFGRGIDKAAARQAADLMADYAAGAAGAAAGMG
ncbi:MAG: cysteine desulfurase family protein [Alphaproteobacteria bacterium]|nr:cysteine desulfurase family protein [Alphaproteobacteria bacterium]